MQKRMKRTYIIHFSNHFVMMQIFISKEELGGSKVRQLWFQFSPPLFNKAVKNDVEKAVVTSVTLRDFGPFSPLHLMRCGILKNCERCPKRFIHQAFLMELKQLTGQAVED